MMQAKIIRINITLTLKNTPEEHNRAAATESHLLNIQLSMTRSRV
jgi:hypothetical protein